MADLRTASGIQAHGASIRYTRTTDGNPAHNSIGHGYGHHSHGGRTVVNNFYGPQPIIPNYGYQQNIFPTAAMPVNPYMMPNQYGMMQTNAGSIYSMTGPTGVVAASAPPVNPNSTFGKISQTFGKVANVSALFSIATGAADSIGAYF